MNQIRRRSRRLTRLAAAAAVSTLTVAAMAACGTSSKTTTAAAGGGTPVSGGTLRLATAIEPECLNPEVGARDVDAVIDRDIFDSLVEMTPDGTFHPWLATQWTVSPDGLTYTFTLRPGVKFQDGTALDAASVKSTLDYAVNPATKSYYAASLISAYASSKVVDPTTVQVTLSRPSISFLQALSTPFLGIQSPASLKANASDLCSHPVGSGPFSFVSWTKGTSVTLKRNPDYDWGPSTATHTGAAYLSGVTFLFVPDDAVRAGLLSSGQADAIAQVPPNDVAQIHNSYQYQSVDQPGAVYTMLLNVNSGPLSDEKVREALQRSLNLAALVKSVYFGQYQRAWSVLSPSTTDYDAATANSWPYDPTLANQLLDQAGWTGRDANGYRTKDGQSLVVKWPYASALMTSQELSIGQGVQAEAKSVGIDVQFTSQDPGTLDTELVSGKGLDVFSESFVRANPDILRFLFSSQQKVTEGGSNVFGIDVPQLDGWLNAAAGTDTDAARKTDYAQAQQYIDQNVLAIPLFVQSYLFASAKNVHAITFDAQAYPVLYDAWTGK